MNARYAQDSSRSSTTDRQLRMQSGRSSQCAWHPGYREGGDAEALRHGEIHRAALQAARQAVLAMRANDEIGDDAFHLVEEELDWLEMAIGSEPE